jgi:hypothetical protein
MVQSIQTGIARGSVPRIVGRSMNRKALNSMLLIAGGLALLLALAFGGLVMFLKPLAFDDGVLVHSEQIAAKDWPFKAKQRPSFHRLYVRIIGWQDHSYYFAFSGESREITAFFSELEAHGDTQAYDVDAEIRELNREVQQWDADYIAHGWDLAPGQGVRVFKHAAAHELVLVNANWTRMWYNSYTL